VLFLTLIVQNGTKEGEEAGMESWVNTRLSLVLLG
jgi:hypothetical protein